ncbi:MAG: DinB family protein [Mobilitalea sp.]
MDVSTIRFLAKYNEVTNIQMNSYIKSLSEEDWVRKFGGYFSSIRSLCNHLCTGDFIWLKRLSQLRQFDYIKEDFFLREIRFGTHAFETKEEYLELRKKIDEFYKKFAEEVREDDCRHTLMYKDSHGDEHIQDFGLVVLHVFNHQTHHRGMVSLYLEEMKIENDYSNIMDII